VLATTCKPALQVVRPRINRVSKAVTPGIKLPERESDHSLSYRVQDVNVQSYLYLRINCAPTSHGYFI
jgi:hypothetical protein